MKLISLKLVCITLLSSCLSSVLSYGKIDPENPASFNHKYQLVSQGVNFHYVDEGPKEGPVVVLMHGFPESWYTWRYQIPYLANLGFRVIALDMIGYGQTKLNKTVERLDSYSFEFNVKAIKTLVHYHIIPKRKNEKISIVGHDWGSFTTWAYANYFGKYLDATVTLSIPYFPPEKEYLSMENWVKQLPIAGYQLALSKDDVKLYDANVKKFLDFFWRIKYTDISMGTALSVPIGKGLLEHAYSFNYTLGSFPDDKYMNYLINQYTQHGCEGAANWYRTREINWKNNNQFLGKNVTIPNLTVIGQYDITVPFIEASKPYVNDLTVKLIPNTGHWIQLSHPQEVNTYISDFLKVKLGAKFPKSA